MQEKTIIKNHKILRNIFLYLIALIFTLGAFIIANNKITVYADYSSEIIKPVEYYNELFKDKSVDEIYDNYNLELMQRMFVSKVGYSNLVDFLNNDESQDNKYMISWLYNTPIALKDFVTGGVPNGGDYIEALKVLSKLYKSHNIDLSDTTDLFEPELNSTRKRGDVYRTMMISIALTHARGPYSWMSANTKIDPLERYESFKFSYLVSDYHLRYDIFENLNVEEMRYLMSNRINNNEIYWLNAYATINCGRNGTSYPNVYSPHIHMRYGRDWDYAGKGYYKEENFEQYDKKYMLTEYGVTFSTNPRLWMVFEGSQICWGISYTGTNFTAAFGVPSHYVRQPDHAAFLVYNKDSNGRSIWTIDNDIFGWTKTWVNEDTVGNGNNRMMCDWGTLGGEQVKHYNATYILLAQTALDNQENYEKAELLLSLDNLINDKESLYRKVLTIMPYHFDAWYNLVKLYINNEKTDTEITSLAEEITENMYYFPLPMHELILLLTNELKSRNTESSLIQLANVLNIDTIALQKGINAINDDNAKKVISQPDICKIEATYLLGLEENNKLATFSFDGENKNKLVINTTYSLIRYKYSLDNGLTWSETITSDTMHELTSSEINLITSENDILIWLDGWGTINKEKAYRIDILPGSPIKNIENNDNENTFLGIFDNLEYSLDETNWQDLTSESYFEGDKIVYVRNKNFNTTLPGEITTFIFTNNIDENRKYIPISKITLNDFSSEEVSQNDYAKHIIDGKLSTRWHTKWKGGDYDRYITVELDEFKYISGIDYTPAGGNGTMIGLQVYVSTNGTDWTLAKNVTGLANNTTKKQISFTPVYGKFVKIVGTNTVGGFASARLIEFFEDNTLNNKQINGIRLLNEPNKKVYVLNQEININGLLVELVFEDNSTAIIPNNLLDIENVVLDTIGTKSVNVGYLNFEKTLFNIQVINISDSEALIGNEYYHTLQDAITDVESESIIELLKDVEVENSFILSKNITINGNGHILKRKSDFLSAIFEVNGGGNLTLNNIILDGGAIYSGDINNILNRGTANTGINANAPLIKTSSSAILNINDSTLKNNFNITTSRYTGGSMFAEGTSKIIITNSIIENCYAYLFGSAFYLRDSSSITINSGKFFGNSGNTNTMTFCIDNNAKCTILGGEFYNNLAGNNGVLWLSNGKLDIAGGKFFNNYATVGKSIFLNGNGVVNLTNFEEIEEIYLTNGKKINILGILLNKILNIKLKNPVNDTTIAICQDNENKLKILRAIVVENKMLYFNDNELKIYDKSNANAKIDIESREVLFNTFDEAINASESGETITLLNNVELNDNITIEKYLTINFSNFSFVGTGKVKTTPMFCLKNKDNLIIISDHIFNKNITYSWSTDYSSCTAVGYCECGESYSETVTSLKQITTNATCETEEFSKFTASFSFSNFESQIKENIKTGDKLSHNFTDINYIKPTCKQSGIKQHKHCSLCNKNYIDNEIVNDVNISKIVHSILVLNNITYSWSTDYSSCTAIGYCECGESYSETVTSSKQITTNATCETEEFSKFTASFSFSNFESQIKENIKTSEKLTEPNDSGENNSQNNGSNQNNNSEQNNKNNQNFKDKLLIILIPVVLICIILPSITTIILIKKKKSKK